VVLDWTLRERYRSSTGDVRWDRLGTPGLTPVVLLHGTPFSSYVWRTVANALAGTADIFVWDMPGFGTSQMTADQDVSLASQGRVFTELLGHWELREPSVVAHDVGGAVALRATLLHGVPFRRLALVDPVALRPWGSPFFRLVRDNTRVFEQLPEPLHRALVREYVADTSSPGLSEAVLDRLVQPWLGPDGQGAFYRQIAQADERDTDAFQDRLGAMTIPVLICWGADDRWIPWTQGEILAARIPGARFRPIEGAGHLVQEDAPAALTRLLIDFLAIDA